MLQSRDALSERGPAGLSVGGVEVCFVQPSMKRPGRDFDGSGRLLHSAVRQEGGGRFLPLGLQFCDISRHYLTPAPESMDPVYGIRIDRARRSRSRAAPNRSGDHVTILW